MPTLKEESFSFGGVDSRSNPANYPPNRALRCINYTPQSSGALRLRQGYTIQENSTLPGGPIHSAIYYEQFSASYVGPQFVLYGQGSNILLLNMALGLNSSLRSFSTSNPWGHFRANNRVFISDGVTNLNWDGTLPRTTGIPAPPDVSFPGAAQSQYASTAADLGGIHAWATLGNITGAPDGNYASANASSVIPTNTVSVAGFGFAIPVTAKILGVTVTVTGDVSGSGLHHIDLVLAGPTGPLPGGRSINFTGGAGPTSGVAGTSTDGWGGGLTAAIVNDPTFAVQITGRKSGIGGSVNWFLDGVQVTVFYTAITGVVVSVTSSTLGSIAPTQLSGYQLYAALYNPITQHMGNRYPIGSPQTVSATLSAFVITSMPDPTIANAEWRWALGMTNDGGQVPYWFVDPQGNNIVLGAGATTGTVYIGNVNALQELPFRNDPPPPFDKYARVGTRIFAGLAGNPFLSYSNDVSDVSNANYVGVPEESWPGDQQEPLPTGELPTSIQGYRLEGWFFSRNNLCIWSQFLLQQGANPWRGPWPGGCPAQRAFIETPHGPFWLNSQKQLCTFMEDGVISVSDEYESALLAKIAYVNIAKTELGYLLDKESLTDEIVVRGLDVNGNPVIVVHDFTLKDERSPHGQGYQYVYAGITPRTFVGSGFTPRQNVFDVNGHMRLWAGTSEGTFAQLEDGLDDNGATISGDYVGLVGLGKNRRSLEELEYQGDPNFNISYCPDYSLTINDMLPVSQDVIGDDVQTQTRFGAKLGGEETRWCYFRMQLDSHPADGNYSLTDPPFFPMPAYGVINETVLKLGASRPEAR